MAVQATRPKKKTVDWVGITETFIAGGMWVIVFMMLGAALEMCIRDRLSSGGDCQKAVAFGNATAAVKNTIPGDLPSSNLEEIETIIKAHNQTGPQSEMAR